MADSNPYWGLPIAEIQAALADAMQERKKIYAAMQNYSANGFTGSRAALTTVLQDIAWANKALKNATGQRVTTARAITVPGGF